MWKVLAVIAMFFSPLIIAGLAMAQQPPQGQPQAQPNQQMNPPSSDRYRARITGTAQDGSALVIGTNYDFPTREACQSSADQPPVNEMVNKLRNAQIASNINVQCRKLPSRNTNATPNIQGSGTSFRTPASIDVTQPNR
jgi:hypothetical protein